MDLSFAPSSSPRFPAISPHCSTSSYIPPISANPTTAKPASFLSSCRTNLYSIGLSRSCSKSLLSCRNKRNSIWARSQVGAAESDPVLTKVSDFKDACWRFLRPHTIRGTVLGSTALVTRALIENSNLIKWVNKPYLPIAAGDLSVKSAWLLVVFFAVTGLLIVGLNFGAFITSLYCLGLFLGTIYSVPPLRMKRFPVAAFLIIATVRGFLLNFGVYYATRAALGLQFEWSSAVAFITTFVTLFALVIAITKDLPDVEGDRKFEISTFATKLGVRNIAFLGSGLLLLNYVGSIFAASLMPEAFRRSLMIPMHAILALSLVFQTWVLEQANYTKEAIASYYRFIWNLFYAEYLLFPFI
ncbi:unnamed protein product [Malus baccata var. baccata]